MKRTLIISPVFPPEPVVSAKLSLDIANSISEKGSVAVITQKSSRPFGFKFDAAELKFSFNVIRSNTITSPRSALIGRFRESYAFGKYCYRYISENHSDIKVIYANTWPLCAQWYAVKAAKKYDIPIVIHVQDIYPESITNRILLLGGLIRILLKPIDSFVLRNASKVIAISESMRAYLVSTRSLDPQRVVVVRNWQEEDAFVKQEEVQSTADGKEPFTFMYLGNIGPVAGVELLIHAFAEAKLPDCRLVIAGSGTMKEGLKALAGDKQGVNIEFWNVPDGKVPETQGKADVLLLPVKKGAAMSSIPSKLPAYMFSQKPILASVDKKSDTAACILEANCGFVLDPENAAQLSECMNKMKRMKNEQLRTLGENGFQYAVRNLSKRHNLERIIKTIGELELPD